MIEANGDNKNGGIFSYSTEPSLLTCPPKGFKLKLLKKFGNWNEETESLAKYAPYITSSDGVFVKTGSAVSMKLDEYFIWKRHIKEGGKKAKNMGLLNKAKRFLNKEPY